MKRRIGEAVNRGEAIGNNGGQRLVMRKEGGCYQHLSIAYGSLAEVETHLQLAQRLNYIDRGF